MKGRIGISVLVAAVIAAAASGLYLRRVKQTVERTFTPVPVAAPDLFPADTLLFAAAHRMDESWNAVEEWWKRVEPTAAWHLVRGEWDRARERGSLPPALEEAVGEFERAMDGAEARLGHRPDTRQFFETYGRYTAFGLLPAADGGRPRMLLVVKLPGEAAMELLRQKLGGVARRHDPPEIHGYPAFAEEGGRLGRVLYGVGGGYLFVADDEAVLGTALGRLASSAAGGAAAGAADPGPSLAAAPVFRKAVPENWEEVGLAFFVRREQQFARWDAKLKPLDDYLAHGFVLAPGEKAVALCAVRIPGGQDFDVRASFGPRGEEAGPWAGALPAGMSRAWMTASPPAGTSRAALLADVEEFRAKRIWKEADALLRDGPRLRRILEDALGDGAAPGDEILGRLPRDGELLAALFNGAVDRALLSRGASLCFGQKTMDGDSIRVESVAGMRFGPLESFLVAAALDLLVEKQGRWIREGTPPLERVAEPGFLAWRFRLTRLLEESRERGEGPGPGLEGMLSHLQGMEPAIVLAGGALWFTMGEGIYDELRGVAAGTVEPLSADPLYVEALAAVPAGATSLDFARPAELLRGMVEGTGGQLRELMGGIPDPEPGEILEGTLAALREAVAWGKGVRATMAAGYADPSRPSESVALLDPAADRARPLISMDPAAPAVPGVLPAGTFLLMEERADVRPAAEAAIAAFLRGLPGGRERWDELRGGIPLGEEDLEGRLDALILDVKGEAGVALAAPAPGNADVLRGTQDMIDRIPALVMFAAYARPGAAFDALAGLFDEIAAAAEERVPFVVRRRLYDRRQGPRPVEVEVERTAVEGRPVAILRVTWPEGPRGDLLTAGMALVRRDDLVFLTTSLPVGEGLAAARSGAAGTLAERMARELPADVLPAECAGLFVSRADGFADCLSLYSRPLAPGLARLSLRSRGGPPDPERIEAHEEGWREFERLFDDLLRSGRWVIASTVREKDRLHTTTRRVKGK